MAHFPLTYPLCLILLGQALPLAQAGERVTVPDLLRMRQGGLRDATILDFIRAYEVTLVIPEAQWADLGKAGLGPGTLQALRDHAVAHPPQEPAPEAGPTARAPLPRFFVGYPHDPAAFPAWYYGPFAGEDTSASQLPGRGRPRGGLWRNNARAVWFHGRRL